MSPGRPQPGEQRILIGDAAATLATLDASTIDCVITSPPYFRLRNYQHRQQLGLEATVHEWVEHLVGVLHQVARVLKPSGTVWLNIADSYSRHDRVGAPPKGLVLAPERLVLALASDGWIVRNQIVWAKPNPMPSSVRDRLTSGWERLYLLTRSPEYFFDLDAIREPHRSQTPAKRPQPVRRPRIVPQWQGPLAGNNDGLERLKASGRAGHLLGKNPGDVWTLASSSFRGAHFATFPEALVRRPLLAGCPERVCIDCGRPWRRSVPNLVGQLAVRGELAPGCECRAGWQPGLVLDPFLGSGTTAVVAERLSRRWMGIELNPDFAAIAERRLVAFRVRTSSHTTWRRTPSPEGDPPQSGDRPQHNNK